MKTFYVYILRDPRPGKNLQPIYVGKGNKWRPHQHWYRAEDHPNPLLRRVFSKILQTRLEPQIEIAQSFDVETDAFQLEIELISKYGRRDLKTGTLCNLTNGGEGASGSLAVAEAMRKTARRLHADPEYRKTLAAAIKKSNSNPRHNKTRSEVTKKLHADPNHRKAISEGIKKFYANPENALAFSEQMKKQRADPEFCRLNAESIKRKFETDPEYAKMHSILGGRQLCKLWADPKWVEAHIERSRKQIRKTLADPNYQKAHLEGIAKFKADPERMKAHAEHSREQWRDPRIRAQTIVAQRATWADPTRRARILAARRDARLKLCATFVPHPCAGCGKQLEQTQAKCCSRNCRKKAVRIAAKA